MKKLAPYIIIAVLLVLLALSFTRNNTEVIVKHTSDTTIIKRIDTIYIKKPIFIYEEVLDTVYVEKDGKTSLPIIMTRRYYAGEEYEAWVSGYKPSLDSINVYSKIITKTIHDKIEKKIYPKTTDWYATFDNLVIDRSYSPNVGISVKFRNDIMAGIKIGYHKHDPYYGLSLGMKLNRRR